jgi:hypothetical protein
MNLLSRIRNKFTPPGPAPESLPVLPLPTKEEQEHITALRNRIEALPALPESGASHTSAKWLGRLHTMRTNILTKDPRSFLRWHDIISTMYTTPPALELEYVLGLSTKTAWENALKENGTGSPTSYPDFPSSSGNLIHHAYHLSQLTHTYNVDLTTVQTIFEFGGGYGSMARLAYQRGFTGTYVIFDLPEFTALQEYFLASLPLPISISYLPSTASNTVVLLSDIATLEQFLQKTPPDITIATWSVSEIPLDLRAKFDQVSRQSTYFLFGYQDTFGGVDNKQYFKQFTAGHTQHHWLTAEISHFPHNHYLIGTSVTA